ncbi:THUMP domain-containing protein 1 [Borealophlyctis nickersoniae]|nr:THUMP domain-containing protein 1 [Borealophlyctis nickersoniae]
MGGQPDRPPKRLEPEAPPSSPPTKRQKPNAPHAKKQTTIPITRGKFKNRFLRKHASLLHKSDEVNGVIVTCAVGNETRALGQARNLLDTYLPALFPDYKTVWTAPAATLDIDLDIINDAESESDPDSDEPAPRSATTGVDSQTSTEADGESKAPNGSNDAARPDRRFQAVDAACSGLLFLRFRVDVSPLDFVLKLFDHAQSLAQADRSKLNTSIQHCYRWLPITHICPATLDDIKQSLPSLITSRLALPESSSSDTSESETRVTTVAIVPEIRNNPNLKRDAVIKTVAAMIPEKGCKVDLKNPDLVLFINVFKSVCGFAILPRYHALKKYNLQAILSGSKDGNEGLDTGVAVASGTGDVTPERG